MKTLRKLLSLVLCLSLCLSLAVPAMAAGENNGKGVTFSVSLDNASIEESSTDQTVIMTLAASQPITMDGLGFTVTWDDALQLTAVNENIDNFKFPTSSTNLENGIVGGQSEDAENISDVTELAVITFTVPANTQPGTYNVGVESIELTADYGEIWENAASASTALTVTGKSEPTDPTEPIPPVGPELTGYSAGISTTTPAATVGEKVYIAVSVNHAEETTFNAGELVIDYDADHLIFDQSGSSLGEATAKASEGTLTLEDYGAEKHCGNGIYMLSFDAIADGDISVTMTRAAFSNLENAASSDLSEADINPDTVDISIGKKSFAVSLPEGMEGAEFVTDGENYTFSISDENYTYSDIVATVDGVYVAVTDNGDGTYTIPAVNGVLKITATRTARSYFVTFEGSGAVDITDGATSATYGTDYSFTMPSANGWTYSLGGITISGVNYIGYSVEGSVYTIPGTAIKGNIVITVNKSQIVNSATVSVTGSGAGAASGNATAAEIGQPYTLTIVPEEGYTYTVTATMGGKAVELTQTGNNYTIAEVTGDIVFTVERAIVVTGVTVSEYVSVNGNKVWLIKNAATLAEGKVPTYNGSNMLWSEEYKAYCYLVIAATLNEEEAQAAVGITDGTAVTVDYGMDVNKTGIIDANDAQLTYNIYNAYYDAFDEVVSLEKFLCADVNKDGVVNTTDAAAIINKILNG